MALLAMSHDLAAGHRDALSGNAPGAAQAQPANRIGDFHDRGAYTATGAGYESMQTCERTGHAILRRGRQLAPPAQDCVRVATCPTDRDPASVVLEISVPPRRSRSMRDSTSAA